MKSLNTVKLPDTYGEMLSTGIEVFDELFGSDEDTGQYGFVRGKLYFVSAPAGTGKSRLFLKVQSLIAKNNPDQMTGYFTAEQDVLALRSMCNKTDVEMPDNMLSDRDDNWENIKRKTLENNLGFVVIDSLPMIMGSFRKIQDEDSGQYRDMKIKEKMLAIQEFAAEHDVVFVLINHCTKSGQWKGSSDVNHLIDVNILLKVNEKDYDEVRCVEFRTEKNREGAKVKRAFPFNGKWDLETPYEIEEEDSYSGADNESKTAIRKQEQKNSLIEEMRNRGGVIHREDIDNGEVSISNLAKSGLLSILRNLHDEKIVEVERASTGKRGQPPIVQWTLVNDSEPAISFE